MEPAQLRLQGNFFELQHPLYPSQNDQNIEKTQIAFEPYIYHEIRRRNNIVKIQ